MEFVKYILSDKIQKKVNLEDIKKLFENEKTKTEKNLDIVISMLEREELNRVTSELGKGNNEPYLFNVSNYISLIEDIKFDKETINYI